MTGYFGGVPMARTRINSQVAVMLGFGTLLPSLALAYWVYVNLQVSEIVQPAIVTSEHLAMEMVDVLLPTQSIEPGKLLTPEMFRKVLRPKAIVEHGMLQSIEELSGQYAKGLLVANVPVYAAQVSRDRSGALPFDIPQGFVAVTIPAGPLTAVDGFVQAGVYVAVNWIFTHRGEKAVTTLVQNAKVLATERNPTADWRQGMPVPTTVTLLARQKDAGEIQLATATGALNLVLRGQPDAGEGPDVTTVSDILKKGQDDRKKDCSDRVRICTSPADCSWICLEQFNSRTLM